jgi:hypothetical protein
MQKVMKSPKSFAKMFESSLCPADKELFKLPELQYLFMRDFQEFSEYLVHTAKDVRLNLIEGQGHFYHLAYGDQMLKKVK